MKKESKKKVKASALAAVTAASLLVGGSYDTPDELFSTDDNALIQTVTAAVSDSDDGSDDSGNGERRDRRGARATVRGFMDSLPEAVRAVVILPLWLCGDLLIALLSALCSAVLTPAFSTLLGWIAVVLIVLAIFAMTVKTVLPDLPLKRILNKRSILTVVLGCFAFGVLDALLPVVCDDYEKLSQLMKLTASVVCTLVPTVFFLRRYSRKRSASESAEQNRDERESDARRLITELADSVCPKIR